MFHYSFSARLFFEPMSIWSSSKIFAIFQRFSYKIWRYQDFSNFSVICSDWVLYSWWWRCQFYNFYENQFWWGKELCFMTNCNGFSCIYNFFVKCGGFESLPDFFPAIFVSSSDAFFLRLFNPQSRKCQWILPLTNGICAYDVISHSLYQKFLGHLRDKILIIHDLLHSIK